MARIVSLSIRDVNFCTWLEFKKRHQKYGASARIMELIKEDMARQDRENNYIEYKPIEWSDLNRLSKHEVLTVVGNYPNE